MKTEDFKYHLPKGLIAQTPIEQRDASRLLVLHRSSGQVQDRKFLDLPEYLSAGDILVENDSRVIPARLFGHKRGTGGKTELLLLSKIDDQTWQVLAGGKKLFSGVEIVIHDIVGKETSAVATIKEVLAGGIRVVEFNLPTESILDMAGNVPLPPYIHERLTDPERYQTVYSNNSGSAAAPTAGLHFTNELIQKLQSRGVLFDTCTLHVSLDTFKPVIEEEVADHQIHGEWIYLSSSTAQRINEVKTNGGRVIAVGTTTARVLETVGLRFSGVQDSLQSISQRNLANLQLSETPRLSEYSGMTDLYIYPGYSFRVIDALITNFHLPESSLMMMISAFASPEQVKAAYHKAIKLNYRFLSLGDAMLIL